MTTRMPTPPDTRKVIVGVDTHTYVHVAVAIDSWGIRLRDEAFVADSGGYQALITWAETHGRIEAFGIEGTGSYGAGLARVVRRAGHRVVEVNRGDRRTRLATPAVELQIGSWRLCTRRPSHRSMIASQPTGDYQWPLAYVLGRERPHDGRVPEADRKSEAAAGVG